MSTSTPDAADDAGVPSPGAGNDQDRDNTSPTPGSDNDGAEAGYTPPSGSDDPVSD